MTALILGASRFTGNLFMLAQKRSPFSTPFPRRRQLSNKAQFRAPVLGSSTSVNFFFTRFAPFLPSVLTSFLVLNSPPPF